MCRKVIIILCWELSGCLPTFTQKHTCSAQFASSLLSPSQPPPPNSMRLSRLVDWLFCDAPSNDLPFTNRVKVLLFDFEQGSRYRDSVNIQFNAMHSNQSRHTLGIVTLFAERICSEQHGKKLNHMLRRWFERSFSVRIKLYPKVNKFQSY